MTKIAMVDKFKNNETMILDGVKHGLAKGLPLGYILAEIGDEIEVQANTMINYWYKFKLANKLPIIYQSMIKASKVKKNKTNSPTTKSDKGSNTNKPNAAKKIYTLVKQTNVDLKHLQKMYELQGEELKTQIKRGFKKVEDNQLSFNQAVNHKLNKVLSLDANNNVEDETNNTKLLIDRRGNVNVIDAPEVIKFDENKVNGLINQIEVLEKENKNLQSDVEFEMNLRIKAEEKCDSIRAELNSIKGNVDKLKESLESKEKSIKSFMGTVTTLQKENKLLTDYNDKLLNQNAQLTKKNDDLSNRGLLDRVFNRKEFNTATN